MISIMANSNSKKRLLFDSTSTNSSEMSLFCHNALLKAFHRLPDDNHNNSNNTSPRRYICSTPSPLTSPSIASVDSMPSTTPPTESSLFNVAKQIQFLISFVCNESVHLKTTMKVKDKQQIMGEMFLGSKPNQIKHADFFVVGQGRFEKCFEPTEDGSLVIKPELTQRPHHIYKVQKELGDDFDGSKNIITLSMLRRKTLNSGDPLSFHNVHTNAQSALRYCKLAVAAGKEFIDSNGNLPSGWSRQDYFDKVLDKMYITVLLESKTNKIKDGTSREKMLTNTRKPGWVFNGFMAFVMFGPLALDPKYKSNKMLNGLSTLMMHLVRDYMDLTIFPFVFVESNGETSISRSALRLIELESKREGDKEAKKESKTNSKVNQTVEVDNLSIHSARIQQRKVEQDNFLLAQLSSSRNTRVKMLMQMNNDYQARADFHTNQDIKRRYDANMVKIDRLMDQMDSLDSTMEDVYEKSISGPSSPKRYKATESTQSSEVDDIDDSVSLLSRRDKGSEDASSNICDGESSTLLSSHLKTPGPTSRLTSSDVALVTFSKDIIETPNIDSGEMDF
jgi:hypothetical protein